MKERPWRAPARRAQGYADRSPLPSAAPFRAAIALATDGICLSGCLPDHAALYGVLGQIETLGLELLDVRRVNRTG